MSWAYWAGYNESLIREAFLVQERTTERLKAERCDVCGCFLHEGLCPECTGGPYGGCESEEGAQ